MLVWLEEEGMVKAERFAKFIKKVDGVEMNDDWWWAVQQWKRMESEEKAAWKKRAEEKANKI